MLVTAALALSLFNPFAGFASQTSTARVMTRHTHIGAWSITVANDRYAGVHSCSLWARDVTLQRGTAIFHVGHGVDTTHAVFHLDGGPPREVSEAFDDVEARGFFRKGAGSLIPGGAKWPCRRAISRASGP